MVVYAEMVEAVVDNNLWRASQRHNSHETQGQS